VTNTTGATVEPVPPSRTEVAYSAAQGFVERVQALGRGELAALKRNAGNTMAEARGVPWFPRLMRTEDEWANSEICFLVATLIGLNKHGFTGDLGRSAKRLAALRSAESVDRRFRIVLDSDFSRDGGQLPYRLRQVVKLLASSDVGVDWAQLLVDLRQWNWSGKPVQQRWARSFYSADHAQSDADAPTLPAR
jgi:CRISPR type I-E-associated protein CasB/Cse2